MFAKQRGLGVWKVSAQCVCVCVCVCWLEITYHKLHQAASRALPLHPTRFSPCPPPAAVHMPGGKEQCQLHCPCTAFLNPWACLQHRGAHSSQDLGERSGCVPEHCWSHGHILAPHPQHGKTSFPLQIPQACMDFIAHTLCPNPKCMLDHMADLAGSVGCCNSCSYAGRTAPVKE